MPIQVTLIGLGQIGASIGLALGAHKETMFRVGNDKKTQVEREALSKGAVDKVIHNLPAAVREAQLVVLCLPISQVRESLEFIMRDLQENTVILDTAPIKAEIFNWAKELLPAGCYYVGLAPALNPEVLHNLNQGVEAAREDLFVKGLFFVDTPPGVPEAVVTLASDFVRILGATPLLADTAESDGLMAVVHLLPQLAAAALLNATVDQPGWEEARKLASRPFAAVTSGLAYQDEIESLKISALQARANVVHSLDVLMAAIKGLRDDIEKADEDGLTERLEAALEGRQRWLNERQSADWSKPTGPPVDVPSFVERLFGSAFSKSRRPR